MIDQIQPEDAQDVEIATRSEDLSSPTALTEDLALAHLQKSDLAAEVIEEIAQNHGVMKSHKVRGMVAVHPHTPRRIALRLIRGFYTFELMRFALTPSASADLRRVADEILLSRIASITLGERISLARRSSGLVAGALLVDKESVVWRAALENPRLTEIAIVKALQRNAAMPAFVECVSHHAKWSVRGEVRMALLRNAHTPLARAIEFARRLRPSQLRDVLHTSRIPERIKEYLRKSHRGGPGGNGSAVSDQ